MAFLPQEDGFGGIITLIFVAIMIGGTILEAMARKKRAEKERGGGSAEGSVDPQDYAEQLRRMATVEEEPPRPPRKKPAPRKRRAPRARPIPDSGFLLVQEGRPVPPEDLPPVEPVAAEEEGPIPTLEERLESGREKPLAPNQKAFLLHEVFGHAKFHQFRRRGTAGLFREL